MFRSRSIGFYSLVSLVFALTVSCDARASGWLEASGCKGIRPKACLSLAMDAMGGREKLQAIQNVRFDVIAHTALVEQSYRQVPFITSYERDHITIDLSHHRALYEEHSVWPEADPGMAESDVTLVVSSDGGAYHLANRSAPCSQSELDSFEENMALGPERLLLTAEAAPDLRYEASENLRSTPHTVLAFHWHQVPVRILLSPLTHLPDAVETMEQFHDFWYFWGDTHQRVYWDNWKALDGLIYPTNQITERNGIIVNSMQVLDLHKNQTLNEKSFALDADAAKRSKAAVGFEHGLKADHPVELASGVTLFPGSWNTTVIKQDNGIVILETPISSIFTDSLFAQVKKMYPGEPIKAVLSTSDSWPHVGGIRYDVAQKVPIYILDLNQPLLDRMIDAPHTIEPDALSKSPSRPQWKIVSGKIALGTGDNRIELYPIRGASTERQYMVYLPKHKLLYASDTLVLNPDGSLYDPELMREVKLAVEREHLDVATVYAMHQEPVEWGKVSTLIVKALN